MNKEIVSKNKHETSLKKHLTVKKRKLEFYKDGDGIAFEGIEDDEILKSFMAAFGSMDFDIAHALLRNLRLVFGKAEDITKLDLDFAFSFIQQIDAQDPIEAMLAIQMLGTHLKSCHCLGSANMPNQTFEGQEANINRATKLSRTFMMQMEALKKYKSNSNQRITVEHISINEGGKAVIGSNINNSQSRG